MYRQITYIPYILYIDINTQNINIHNIHYTYFNIHNVYTHNDTHRSNLTNKSFVIHSSTYSSSYTIQVVLY